MRGATSIRSNLCSLRGNFNPRSSCEERRWRRASSRYLGYFNPRSSCEERPKVMVKNAVVKAFQSTLLMRGATSRPMAVAWVELISIHAPHARSDRMGEDYANHHHISIHAPHARSDATRHLLASRILRFQSTLLMRGATCPRHASQCRYSDFNPRSSCEERPEPFSR